MHVSSVAKLVEYHTMPPAAGDQDAKQVLLPLASANEQAELWKYEILNLDNLGAKFFSPEAKATTKTYQNSAKTTPMWST